MNIFSKLCILSFIFFGAFVFNVFGVRRVRFTQIPRGDELHSAIEKRDFEEVKRLCQRGADVAFVDQDGLTPLAKVVQLCCWACLFKSDDVYLKIIEYFLKNYRDEIDINERIYNIFGS